MEREVDLPKIAAFSAVAQVMKMLFNLVIYWGRLMARANK